MLHRLRALLRPWKLDRRVAVLERAEPVPQAHELRAMVDEATHEAVVLNQAVLVRRIESLATAVDGLRDDLRVGLADRQRHAEEAAAAAQEAAITVAREHAEAAVEVSAGKVARKIDLLRREAALPRSPAMPHTPGTATGPDPETSVTGVDPALYVNLEERFRGEPALIKERQRSYLDRVRHCVDDRYPALDLGCGRGEWLSLLAEQGLPGYGVDSNPLMVGECIEAGLDARQGDLVQHVASLPSGSLGAVTLFQVVEHLPFPVLVATLHEVERVLRPGGVLIAETPNALNLRVAASTFWIDPTHQRPLHPELLVFLATECGFAEAEWVSCNPLGEVPELTGLPDPAATLLRRLAEAVDGPGDVALVARTAGPSDGAAGTDELEPAP